MDEESKTARFEIVVTFFSGDHSKWVIKAQVETAKEMAATIKDIQNTVNENLSPSTTRHEAL